LKKLPILDLNGTNDEALPAEDRGREPQVMEPYAKKYRGRAD